MLRPLAFLPACLLMAAPAVLSGSEIAGYLRLISTQTGSPGRVACRDLDMAMQLKKAGISTDPRSAVAWAASAEQVHGFASEGKLVICSDPSLVKAGAALVIQSEQGRPVLLLHLANARASGVPLSDALLKAARQM